MNGMLAFFVLHIVFIPAVAYALMSLPKVLRSLPKVSKGDTGHTGPTMAQVLLAAKERARQDKARKG